jgi:Uncharacterised nucleotidyltransferase
MPKHIAFLPTPDQELLLHAILSEGQAAIDNWNAWRQRVSVVEVDADSQRLLPLLIDKLRGLGIDHPDLLKYQSVTRYVWFKNQLLIRAAQQVLVSFAEAGIPAMPLKGIALTPLYYGGLRLRPMEDLDILVPTASALQAGRLLSSKGWNSKFTSQLGSTGFMRTRNEACFVNAEGLQLDLHWHISPECCKANADDAFWSHSQRLTLNGFETKTLSDTDHLFHACIHGGAPNDVGAFRWVVDSARILHLRSIEWSRLIAQGQQFDLVRRLQRTLEYLYEVFALPIPTPVISQLKTLEPSRIELFDDRVRVSHLHPFLKAAVWRYLHYCRNRIPGEGLFDYLQEAYGTRSLPDTILSATRRAARGIFRSGG